MSNVTDPNDIDWLVASGANPRTLRGTTSYVPHVAWALLGMVSVATLWNVATAPGAIAIFVCIGVAFALWHVFGSRGSWIALVIIGLGMSGITGWQAVTGARCPAPGTKVFLKENKPPVGCSDVRAGAGSMSVLFGFLALMGIGAPIVARRLEGETDELDVEDPTPA